MSSENNHLSLPPEASQLSLWQPRPIDKVTVDELLRGLKRRSAVAALVGAFVAIGYLGCYYLFLRNYQYSILLQVEPIQPPGARPGATSEAIRNLASLPLPLLSASIEGDATTLLQILNSDIVLKPIYEKFLKDNPDLDREQYSYETFLKSIKIEDQAEKKLLSKGSSKIVRITFIAKDKTKLESALKIIVEELKKFNEAQKQEQISDNLRYLNQEIQKTLSQIDDLDSQLNEFRYQNRVVRPDVTTSTNSPNSGNSASGMSDLQTYTNLLIELEYKRNENRVKLESTQETFNSLKAQLKLSPDEALAASNLAASRDYQQLLGALATTETQLAGERSNLTDQSPTVQALEEQKRQLLDQSKRQARQITIRYQNQVPRPETLIGYGSAVSDSLIGKYLQVKTELEALKRADAELSNQIQATKAEVSRLLGLANPYRKIEQRFATALQSLGLLLQTRQSLQLQIAQRDFTWKVLSDIDDTERYQVSTRLSTALLMALALGGISGVLIALIMDWLDDRFLEVEQIRQQTPLPILGQIPVTKTFDQLAFSRLEAPLTLWGLQHRLPGVSPAFKESFYFLLTQLEVLGSPHALAVMGTSGQEGQTTIALYLALAAAAIGKRVLLVDANLHQPSLHQVLGIPNVNGLGELLQGTMPLPHWPSLLANLTEGLWVLTGGQAQQEPMALFSSYRWFDFLDSTKETFDVVIVDVPAILAAADTYRVLTALDRALLVVRLRKTREAALAEALKACDLGLRQKMLGIVVNGVVKANQRFGNFQTRATDLEMASISATSA
ncbi:GumC family protein [Thermosynechococcus vestitus]|uniref:Tll1199 protein n=1 Tax=Thermosynechococcus vestitus (strain NIES-2133 / IAM M-273 / BP-1) TaxID=197221 RepID=Q8DJM3_THEVB|nr:tyrosine-protein kinase domain-containing protein [Thermosynechococcus vestitus]BAC08751.1 tll1199 [Thermosynechococcus vestitus BP-1]